jgi:cytochrome c2
MRYKYLAILLLSIAIGLTACAGTPAANAVPADTAVPPTDTVPPPTATPPVEMASDPLDIGDPEHGREIFEHGTEAITVVCTKCHTLDGSEGDGPSLQGISERAGDRVPGLSAVEYLRQSITEPSEFVVEGFEKKMSNVFMFLSEEDVNDLIAFLLTQ